MQRLLILSAIASALLLSGCRNCSLWRRGAPCRASSGFDAFASTTAGPLCGIDAFRGGDVTVGMPGCPDCQPGEVADMGSGYYSGPVVDGGVVPSLPAGSLPVEVPSSQPLPPVSSPN